MTRFEECLRTKQLSPHRRWLPRCACGNLSSTCPAANSCQRDSLVGGIDNYSFPLVTLFFLLESLILHAVRFSRFLDPFLGLLGSRFEFLSHCFRVDSCVDECGDHRHKLSRAENIDTPRVRLLGSPTCPDDKNGLWRRQRVRKRKRKASGIGARRRRCFLLPVTESCKSSPYLGEVCTTFSY